MKTSIRIQLLSIAMCLASMSIPAQIIFNFTTTLGNGSFTLNTNNLVYTGDNGTAAGYKDTLDSLVFLGITYTNLDFTVYNNSFIVSGRDGFQILVDKSPFNSDARLGITVSGNSSVVNGLSVADLVTVLSSFDALKTSAYSTLVLYYNPNPPYQQLFGNVSAFQMQVPFAMSSAGVRSNHFGFSISGSNGATVIVEVRTNMSNGNWIPVETNTLNGGSSYFKDATWTNQPGQFYRVRMQ